MTLKQVYNSLHKAYGPQHWWPGETPFEVMVGAILTQNTAWTNVERAIDNLKANNALSAETILKTHSKRLASWLRPSGYFNVKAKRLKNFCHWYQAQGGLKKLKCWDTKALRHGLLGVNGVGAETADDILLYAFNRPVFVIDAYTRRVFSRLGHVEGDESYETLRAFFENTLGAKDGNVGLRVELFGEYHALIVKHGKDYCRSKPRCTDCCLRRRCPSVMV